MSATVAQETIALDQEYVLGTYARAPFVLDHGQGCWLYDTEGNKYLDCVAGIAVNALGHADPALIAALTEQAGRLWHVSNLYHTAPQARLAQKLCQTSFASRVFFCNSGAEANEAAFKFARKWAYDNYGADKHVLVAFTNAFHGRTMGALSATPREKYQAPFRPLVPGVRIAPFNDLAGAEKLIDDDVCGVIVEPVQGESGIHPADTGFLVGLAQLCNCCGALLIFDEVQCGLGRTGTLWAYQGYGVTPDVLTIAKPLGGGLPMGAVLMTERVAATIHVGDHGSTFAGSALVSAVAETVLARVSDPQFLAAVALNGRYLQDRLEHAHLPHVLAIRARGLMCGIDVDVAATSVIGAAYAQGLIVASASTQTLRLVPPLIITQSEIDMAVERLGAALAAV
jgi:acetylornithine/N-succinyldiaminopimelate aminotransferase